MPADEGMQLDQITKTCLDSEGYLVFAAYLTADKDEHERPIIVHQYRRYHFSLEDAKSSLIHLRQFIDKELQELMDAGEEGA